MRENPVFTILQGRGSYLTVGCRQRKRSGRLQVYALTPHPFPTKNREFYISRLNLKSPYLKSSI